MCTLTFPVAAMADLVYLFIFSVMRYLVPRQRCKGQIAWRAKYLYG